ncbi:hypothetical protein Q5762_01385 [Streptomyces sp. P9(2023)]|uniref:hypothetical protein n=1 Tax=Streptomyces sp. P9(2023) TaxID=3064394 RepID=UPI0028F4301B|nr:hypothetical protein [Streptomyces sp. P9(2023)]MDT9687021.1 hypothetical protein [Streptomyces sp. P9(2023)]
MADACCGTDTPAPAPAAAEPAAPPAAIWQVRELQAAAVSGVLLLVSLFLPGPWDTAAGLAALLVGAATFVPGTLRGLLKGRLGVGLLARVRVPVRPAAEPSRGGNEIRT